MAGIRLTQRRVDSLRQRKTVRDVRDTELKGFGIRVMPSGAKRYFIHSQYDGRRVWQIVGDAEIVTEAEARMRARSMLAAHRDGRDIETEGHGNTLFETVAEEVFARYGRRWKPRTLKVNRNYYRKQILPFFEGRSITAIARQDVQAWFSSLFECDNIVIAFILAHGRSKRHARASILVTPRRHAARGGLVRRDREWP